MEQLPDGCMLCRAAGVSFEGRQERVRKLRPGQALVLRKHSGNGFDVYAIGIFDPAECENPLGFVARDIKEHRVFEMVRQRSEMPARVHRVNQGRGGHGLWGFMVAISDRAVSPVATFSTSTSMPHVDRVFDDKLCHIVIRRRSEIGT
jgi:hypothetical protein